MCSIRQSFDGGIIERSRFVFKDRSSVSLRHENVRRYWRRASTLENFLLLCMIQVNLSRPEMTSSLTFQQLPSCWKTELREFVRSSDLRAICISFQIYNVLMLIKYRASYRCTSNTLCWHTLLF